jgi:hypothetical protein
MSLEKNFDISTYCTYLGSLHTNMTILSAEVRQ